MNRIIKLTVALVLAMSGFLVAGGASTAQADSSARSVAPAHAATASKALPSRTKVKIKFKQKSGTSFKVWAKVRPVGGKKKVQLRYSRTFSGKYHIIRRDKMNKKGRADFGRIHKLGYYYVVVPKSKKYAKTASENYLRIYR